MLKRLLATLMLICCSQLAQAEEKLPKRLIGFLQKGQHVGLFSREGQGTRVTIFESKSDKELHQDAERMSVNELRKRHPKAEELAKRLEVAAIESAKKSGKGDVKPRIVIGRYAPLQYAIVMHVGDDYVLLRFENSYKAAYSARQISRVTWDSGSPNLYCVGLETVTADSPELTKDK